MTADALANPGCRLGKLLMRYQAVVLLTLLLASWPLPGARAEVRSITLGITLNCPYGLAG